MRCTRRARLRLAGGRAGSGARHGRRPIFVGEGDLDAARALVASSEDAELFLYSGDEHYFGDSTLPSYDAEAAALLLQRTFDFLARGRRRQRLLSSLGRATVQGSVGSRDQSAA